MGVFKPEHNSFEAIWNHIKRKIEDVLKVDEKTIEEIKDSLTNEDNENFVFGVKDGVRGFYTNPSRADDSFVPFSRKPEQSDFFIGKGGNTGNNNTSYSTSCTVTQNVKSGLIIVTAFNGGAPAIIPSISFSNITPTKINETTWSSGSLYDGIAEGAGGRKYIGYIENIVSGTVVKVNSSSGGNSHSESLTSVVIVKLS